MPKDGMFLRDSVFLPAWVIRSFVHLSYFSGFYYLPFYRLEICSHFCVIVYFLNIHRRYTEYFQATETQIQTASFDKYYRDIGLLELIVFIAIFLPFV